jgi:IclR family transcriptional regulator, KDG regulon repressor
MAATIQSLERGLVILDILGKSGKPLVLNEIAEHFSLDRSSVFRLVATLVKTGFVIQNEETKQYSLGYKILQLSVGLNNNSYSVDLLRPVIRKVYNQTNQNSHLAVLDGNQVVFLAVEQPREHLSLHVSVGTREPAVVTALGKSLLAFLPEDELKKTLTGVKYEQHTPRSVSNNSQLKKDLKEIRKIRLAFDDEEYRSGIVCFAAPVFNHVGEVVYSLGISGLRDVIKPEKKRFGDIVKKAASEASELLGFHS